MIYFTLYSRSYCHLCDEMRVALENMLNDISHQLSIVDIDQHPALVKQYDELVPVLFAHKSIDATSSGVGKKLCHYFLDPDQVKEFCNE